MLITLEQQALDNLEPIPNWGGYPITIEPRREAPKARVFEPTTATFRELVRSDLLSMLTTDWQTIRRLAEKVAVRRQDLQPLLDELERDGVIEVYISKLGRGKRRIYYRRQG